MDNALPPAVLAVTGGELESLMGHAFPLITVDQAGWPHHALLSAGELVVVDPSRVRIATWARTGTTRNLRENGKGSLIVIADGAAYHIRFTCVEFGIAGAEFASLATFDCAVVSVIEDRVGYAQMVSGPRFAVNDTQSVLERWRVVTAAMRRAPRVRRQ